jgi:hypothetical protein
MKKIVIFLISISLISVIFLSGCQTPEPLDNGNTDIVVDTDNDGYPDDEDDFPFEKDFHLKEYIWNPGTISLKPGESTGQEYYVEGDWKGISVNWNITTYLSKTEQHNITLDVTIPPDESFTNRYYYDERKGKELRFPIIGGNWEFYFSNRNSPLYSYTSIANIYIEIYIFT